MTNKAGLNPIVLDLLSAVCIFFYPKSDRQTIAQLLNRKNLLDELKNFDTKCMTVGQHNFLDKLVHKKSFNLQNLIVHCSDVPAAIPLMQWVIDLHKIEIKHLIREAEATNQEEAVVTRFSTCKELEEKFKGKFVSAKKGKHSRSKTTTQYGGYHFRTNISEAWKTGIITDYSIPETYKTPTKRNTAPEIDTLQKVF